MIRHRLVLTLLLLMICSPPTIHGQLPQVTAITIDQAVNEALDHNLTLLAERFNVNVADAAVLTAGLRPNPVLTASLMLPDPTLVSAGIGPHEQIVRTDYVVERGGKRQRRLDQAVLAKTVVALQLVNTSRILRLAVEHAFTDVQLAERNLSLARENLKAFDDVVRINAERVRTGDLSPVELSRSRLASLQFQNDVRQQDTKLRTAKNRLSTLMGRAADGDGLEVTGELRNDAEPVDYELLRNQALDARPDVRALRADQARSVADTRLQLANGTIDYTISGEYHRQEGSNLRGNSYGLFFSAPLPIFNRNQGEVARAGIQQQQTRAKSRRSSRRSRTRRRTPTRNTPRPATSCGRSNRRCSRRRMTSEPRRNTHIAAAKRALSRCSMPSARTTTRC
jgi:cobalt-zinc-cadmium efflux system outer membrane protein